MDILRGIDGRTVLVDKVEVFVVGVRINKNDPKDKKGTNENAPNVIGKICPEELRKRKNPSESNNR